MTGVGPTSQRPNPPFEGTVEPAAPPSPAIERANRMNAANMLRSMLPLVVICLIIVGWTAWRQSGDAGVRTIDPSTTVQLASARASYPVLAPAGLDEDYRTTYARTDAGDAGAGDPVTLEIGYLTPEEEFAGFVVSDDPRATPLTDVLDDAVEEGTIDIGGETWTRSTTVRDETALVRAVDGVTVVVFGSAAEDELETVAAAVETYSA